MKLGLMGLALLVAAQVHGDQTVKLRHLSCSALQAPLKSSLKGNVRLSGIVRKKTNGSYTISYSSYLELTTEDGEHLSFSVAKEDGVENDPRYQPRVYKEHVRFPLSFDGEALDFIFPENFKAHGEMKTYLMLHGFQDSASGTVTLTCQ